MRHAISLILLMTSLVGVQAQAQDCPSYAGQNIAYTDVNTLLSQLSAIPMVKDEFETTVQFEAKQSKALEHIKTTIFVPAMFDNKYVKYDADTQILSVKSYAISNINTTYDDIFGYGSPLYKKIEYSSLYGNIDVVLSHTENAVGQYEAENAYGAKINVVRVKRNTVAVFEREGEYGEGVLTPPRNAGGGYSDDIIASFPNTPVDIARKAKNTFKGGFLITLKAPYLAKGKVDWNAPTISNPREIDEDLTVIFADIRCGVLTDENNKVFAAFDTR